MIIKISHYENHIPVLGPLIVIQSDTQYLIFSNPEILCKTLPQWKKGIFLNGRTVNSCLIRHLVNCFRRPSRSGDLTRGTGHGQKTTRYNTPLSGGHFKNICATPPYVYTGCLWYPENNSLEIHCSFYYCWFVLRAIRLLDGN